MRAGEYYKTNYYIHILLYHGNDILLQKYFVYIWIFIQYNTYFLRKLVWNHPCHILSLDLCLEIYAFYRNKYLQNQKNLNSA